MIMLVVKTSRGEGVRVDVIVAIGDWPKKKALDWLMCFCAEQRRCFVHQIGEE